MCFVSKSEKVRSSVHFVTFPESAIWSPSLRENSLEPAGDVTDSETETECGEGGDGCGGHIRRVAVGYSNPDTAVVEELMDLVGPLLLSRSVKSQLLFAKI